MKIAYIDNDQEELDCLTKYISQMLSENTVFDTFLSETDFFENWSNGKYDLIFLDIYMDEMLGVDIARKIRETDHDVQLAFCTISNEFASESYEVNARYYLQKPFSAEKIKSMLDRLNLDEIKRARAITLPSGQNIILRNIIYIDYAGHNVTIHNKKGGDVVIRIPQSELEKIFREFSFIYCCFKGVFVNFYEVESLNTDVFVMKNGSKLPVSRRKAKEITEAYRAFRFERMRNNGDY